MSGDIVIKFHITGMSLGTYGVCVPIWLYRFKPQFRKRLFIFSLNMILDIIYIVFGATRIFSNQLKMHYSEKGTIPKYDPTVKDVALGKPSCLQTTCA